MKTPKEIIDSIIVAKHLSTRKFALLMGQPYSKIYDIHRGKTQVLSSDVIRSIKNTYNVCEEYLETGEGEIFKTRETSPAVANNTSLSGNQPFIDYLIQSNAAQRLRIKELEEEVACLNRLIIDRVIGQQNMCY